MNLTYLNSQYSRKDKVVYDCFVDDNGRKILRASPDAPPFYVMAKGKGLHKKTMPLEEEKIPWNKEKLYTRDNYSIYKFKPDNISQLGAMDRYFSKNAGELKIEVISPRSLGRNRMSTENVSAWYRKLHPFTKYDENMNPVGVADLTSWVVEDIEVAAGSDLSKYGESPIAVIGFLDNNESASIGVHMPPKYKHGFKDFKEMILNETKLPNGYNAAKVLKIFKSERSMLNWNAQMEELLPSKSYMARFGLNLFGFDYLHLHERSKQFKIDMKKNSVGVRAGGGKRDKNFYDVRLGLPTIDELWIGTKEFASDKRSLKKLFHILTGQRYEERGSEVNDTYLRRHDKYPKLLEYHAMDLIATDKVARELIKGGLPYYLAYFPHSILSTQQRSIQERWRMYVLGEMTRDWKRGMWLPFNMNFRPTSIDERDSSVGSFRKVFEKGMRKSAFKIDLKLKYAFDELEKSLLRLSREPDNSTKFEYKTYLNAVKILRREWDKLELEQNYKKDGTGYDCGIPGIESGLPRKLQLGINETLEDENRGIVSGTDQHVYPKVAKAMRDSRRRYRDVLIDTIKNYQDGITPLAITSNSFYVQAKNRQVLEKFKERLNADLSGRFGGGDWLGKTVSGDENFYGLDGRSFFFTKKKFDTYLSEGVAVMSDVLCDFENNFRHGVAKRLLYGDPKEPERDAQKFADSMISSLFDSSIDAEDFVFSRSINKKVKLMPEASLGKHSLEPYINAKLREDRTDLSFVVVNEKDGQGQTDLAQKIRFTDKWKGDVSSIDKEYYLGRLNVYPFNRYIPPHFLERKNQSILTFT